MELLDMVFIWIGRLTAFIGLLAMIRWLLGIRYSRPEIVFGTPESVEDLFGRTWKVPISNTRLTGLASKLCTRKDIPKCRICGEFTIDGQTRTHNWGTDPALPIELPANSEPYELELINKKQGHSECIIEGVSVNEYQRLPGDRTIAAKLSVLEGGKVIDSAKYRIENYGANMSGLRVFREEAKLNEEYKGEIEPKSFKPLSMGLVFFGFSLVLWGSGQLTGLNIFVPWLALIISVLCAIAVVVRQLRTFLRRQGWSALVPFGMVAFFFSYFVNLLGAISKNASVVSYAILVAGLAWIAIVFIAMSKGLPRAGQYLVTALFFVPSVIYLFQAQFLLGLILLIFAAGVFSSKWLPVEDMSPL